MNINPTRETAYITTDGNGNMLDEGWPQPIGIGSVITANGQSESRDPANFIIAYADPRLAQLSSPMSNPYLDVHVDLHVQQSAPTFRRPINSYYTVGHGWPATMNNAWELHYDPMSRLTYEPYKSGDIIDGYDVSQFTINWMDIYGLPKVRIGCKITSSNGKYYVTGGVGDVIPSMGSVMVFPMFWSYARRRLKIWEVEADRAYDLNGESWTVWGTVTSQWHFENYTAEQVHYFGIKSIIDIADYYPPTGWVDWATWQTWANNWIANPNWNATKLPMEVMAQTATAMTTTTLKWGGSSYYSAEQMMEEAAKTARDAVSAMGTAVAAYTADGYQVPVADIAKQRALEAAAVASYVARYAYRYSTGNNYDPTSILDAVDAFGG